MNLFLRPLDDVTDVTWSIIWCMIILLTGVAYYIYTIMRLAFQELRKMAAMTPPNRKSCYNFRVVEINKVLDGDTLMSLLIWDLIYTRKKELELQESIRQRRGRET